VWIESHQTLRNHPKTRRLCRELNITTATALGLLHMLWWWAVDYAPDGDLTNAEPQDLADALDWPGNPGPLIAALIKSGYVDRDRHGGELLLHDWLDYQGHLFVRRAANRERQKRLRERSQASNRANALRLISNDTMSRATGPTGPDQPDQPDQTKPGYQASN
jgi:hypothetical protein